MSFSPNVEVVLRPEDGERTGYLAPEGELWMPLNLIGFPLGKATDRATASELVVATGLASMDGQWWCRGPLPFAQTEAELRAPAPDWTWRKVVVVEVNPEFCSIRPALAWPEEQGRSVRLALPATELLRQTQPPD